MKHVNEQEHVYTEQKKYIYISDSSFSSSSDDSRQKKFQMNRIIHVQGKYQLNQCRHLINHPHFRVNTTLMTNKNP